MNILAILGVGAALYKILKPSSALAVPERLVVQATNIAQQQMSVGVPASQAAAAAASAVVDQEYLRTMNLPTPGPQRVEVLILWADALAQQGRDKILSDFGLTPSGSSFGKLISYWVQGYVNPANLAQSLRMRDGVKDVSVQSMSSVA